MELFNREPLVQSTQLGNFRRICNEIWSHLRCRSEEQAMWIENLRNSLNSRKEQAQENILCEMAKFLRELLTNNLFINKYILSLVPKCCRLIVRNVDDDMNDKGC